MVVPKARQRAAWMVESWAARTAGDWVARLVVQSVAPTAARKVEQKVEQTVETSAV